MNDPTPRNETREPPPQTPAAVDTYEIRRCNDYLVELVKELTGYRVWMQHPGLFFADRVRDLSPAEVEAGVLRTLPGYAGPVQLAEQIHQQVRLATSVAAREASRI